MASATLFAIFLLSALSFYPPSTTAQPVTDENGKIVKNGGRFYIKSFSGAGGGGIRRARTGNETWPRSVVQSPLETDDGEPWYIVSIFRSMFIPEGSAVYINYAYDSTKRIEWSPVAGLPEGSLVKVGYQNIINGFFTIHRASSANSYKFLFCGYARSFCGNVGIVLDEAGNRLLAINQEIPFEFVLEELPFAVSK